MSTPQFDLDVYQGATFGNTFHWYAGDVFRAPIEEVLVGYPTIVKVTAHGLPTNSKTPVIISGVKGCTAINSEEDNRVSRMEYLDADHFKVPISTVGVNWTKGSGEITYTEPYDITSFTARMQIREKWHSSAFLAELTTENGGITLTTEGAMIYIEMTAAVTAAFTFNKAVYDLEMVAPSGKVHRIIKGVLTLHKEVTK